MAPETILRMLIYAASLAAMAAGMGAALAAGNLIKKLGGLALAQIGGALLCVGLGAHGLALALIAVLAAEIALGAAIAARIAEAYGAVEADVLRAADAKDDAR